MGNFYGNTVGLRLGQLAGIGVARFGTNALMQSANWTAAGTETEYRDGTGKIQAVNFTPSGHEATFKYYVATNTVTISASIIMPAYGEKFSVTNTGDSGSLNSTTWIAKKVSYEEVLGHENATEVTVDAMDYGF